MGLRSQEKLCRVWRTSKSNVDNLELQQTMLREDWTQLSRRPRETKGELSREEVATSAGMRLHTDGPRSQTHSGARSATHTPGKQCLAQCVRGLASVMTSKIKDKKKASADESISIAF